MTHAFLAKPQRWLLSLLLGAMLFRLCLLISAHWLLPLTDIVELLDDDAYYYLTIARHLANGDGSTFGGVNLTNGYQWLWQMVLAWIAKVLPDDRALLIQVTTFISYGVLACLAGILFWRARQGRDIRRYAAMLAGLLMAAYLLRDVFWQGMETTLFLLLYPALVTWAEGRLRVGLVLIITFVLLPLVRLDALALVAAGYVLMWARGELAQNLKTLQGWLPLLVSGMVMAAYVAWNLAQHGLPVPVSGLSKSLDSPRFGNFGIVFYYVNWPTTVAVSLWLLAEWSLRHAASAPDDFRRSIALMAVATLIQYVYYACFSGWPLWSWYLYLEAGLVATIGARLFIMLPALWDRMSWRTGGRLLVVIAMIGLAITGAVRTNVTRPLLADGLSALCHQTRFCLSPPARQHSFIANNLTLVKTQGPLLHNQLLAMGDRAGSLGYWLPEGTRLLQLEGLVEDQTFLAARLGGHLENYLAAHKVTRLIVDRETFLTLDGLTIVAEPIQGRISHRGITPLCFPPAAVLYAIPSAHGSETRIYDFTQRAPCPPSVHALIASLAHAEKGLRRLSLPGEYVPSNSWLARLEARDRRRLAAATP